MMPDRSSLIDQLNRAAVRGDAPGAGATDAAGPDHAPRHVTLEAILDALPFFVMLVDDRHRILFANRMLADYLGSADRHLAGRFCPQVAHGLETPFPGCPLEAAVEAGQPVERELLDESTGRWFSSAIYPTSCVSDEGRAVYLHFVRDVTSQKRARAENRRLSARLEQAMAQVIDGFVPICAGCRQIRAEDGTWHPVERYVEMRSGATFSHGVCPDCAEELYGAGNPRKSGDP